jgi:hypothetical protein
MIGVIGSGSGRGGSNGAGGGASAGCTGAARFGVARRVAFARPLLLAAFLAFLREGLRAGFFLPAVFLRLDVAFLRAGLRLCEGLWAGFFLRAVFLRLDVAFLRAGLRAGFFFRREALRFDRFFATVAPLSG